MECLTNGSSSSRYIAAGFDGNDAFAPVINLTGQRSASALSEAVMAENPSAVLVHAVGYGYERRGCPIWLVRAIQLLRRQHPEVQLLTWFHELYAFGPPWRSSFWLSPIQRWVTAELARLSDGAFTNRHASADWIRRCAPGTPVEVCPTPSNVGEPSDVCPWNEREPVAVVFGGRSQRNAVYASSGDSVRGLLDLSGIERIWDIGPPTNTHLSFAGRPVDVFGSLPASAVSERLQRARLGLIHYDPAFLTKSGIAAAYLSHAVPVRTLSLDARPPRQLAPPCVPSHDVEVDLEQLGRSGFDWYQTYAHSSFAAQRVMEACGWLLGEALPVKPKGRESL